MRGLISAAVVAVAIVLQLAVADRIVFPGGAGPDLVLLTVAALALATGPMAGCVLGFLAGLALDVAPPAGHLVGQDALVFCLVGYACGLLATSPSLEGLPEQEHSALFEIGVTAAGAACGEALAAALGVMLSDPRVTWAAVKHVLPVAIAYDLLLSPFVLFAVAAMLRLAGATGPSRAAQPASASRRAAWAAVPSAGAVRQVAGGNTPRLRLSGQGENWLNGTRGGASRPGAARPVIGRSAGGLPGAGRPGTGKPGFGGREPRLKLGRHGSPAGPASGAAFGTAGGRRGGPPGPAKLRFGGRRGEGVFGGGGQLAGPGRTTPRLASSRLAGSRLASPRRGSFRIAGSRLASPRQGSSRLTGSRLTGSSLTSSRLNGARLASSRLAGSRLGASLLGGSVFSRSGPTFGRSASLLGRSTPLLGRSGSTPAVSGRTGSAFGRSTSLFGRSTSLFGRSRSLGGRGAGGTSAKTHLGSGPHQPKFRGPGTLTRLFGSLRRPAQRKTPGKRWLRHTSASRGRLAGKGLRPTTRAPGRGWLRSSRGIGGRVRRPRKLATPRLGYRRRAGPARLLRIRPRKLPKNSWRRSGGYR